MRDDYLWDKSGEPDSEIEQLEELLGNLRYRRPTEGLPLPAHAPVRPRSAFAPSLAIAAALLLMLGAAGLWFIFGDDARKDAPRTLATGVQPARLSEWLNPESVSAMTLRTENSERRQPERGVVLTTTTSSPERPRRVPSFKRPAPPLTQIAKAPAPKLRERINEDEGVAAREQLIKALHLTSSKLNQVQKKVQDNRNPDPVS